MLQTAIKPVSKTISDHRVDFGLLSHHLGSEVTQLLGDEIIHALCWSYAEYWRFFHDLDHIIRMLDKAEQYKSKLRHDDYIALQLMIVYHDVHYRPGLTRYINEKMSADKAVQDLEDKVGQDMKHTVHTGIMATADHNLFCVLDRIRPVVSLFLDLDLMGLGAKREQFEVDTERVWNEYQPVYTKEQFDTRRKDWARSFLNRENIYHTEYFSDLEGQARENLEAILQQ